MKDVFARSIGLLAARFIAALHLVVSSLAADYTVSGLGTYLKDAADLQVENLRVLSESTLTNGQVILEVTGDIRNSDVGLWEEVSARLNDSVPTNFYSPLALSLEHTNVVNIGALAVNSGVISVIVNAADLDVARLEALAGNIFFVTAADIAGNPITITNASQFPLENIQIVGEHNLSGGRVLLQLNASVRNASDYAASRISIHLLNTAGTVPYVAPTSTLQFGSLTSNAVAAATQPMYLAVNNADVPTLRSNLMAGSAFDVDGLELWVFSGPPRAVDQPTEDAWQPPADSVGAETKLIFTNLTDFLQSLRPGDILLEDPRTNIVSTAEPTSPFQFTPLEDFFPFLVSSMSVSSNNVEVVGRKQLLAEVLKSATFIATEQDVYKSSRNPYDPPFENTYTHEEQAERDEAAALIAAEDPRDGRLADLKGLHALPWHFNLTNIIDRVRFSGQLFFRNSGVKLELKIRNFQLQRVVTRMDAGAVLNMLVEVEGKKPEEEEAEEDSKNLLPLKPLPALAFNLGGVQVTVQPEISLTAGVIENVPTSLTLPLQSSFLIGMEMGWDRSRMTGTNDGFFSEPFVETHPLRISDPTVIDELEMTLGAWAELAMGLKIGIGEGAAAQLRAGPSIAVRLENTFNLAPFANPWWSIDSGVHLIGRFELDAEILGFDIDLLNAQASLHYFPIFHRDAGGPLIRGLRAAAANTIEPVEPIVGQSVRWAQVVQPRANWSFNQAFAFTVPGSSNEIVVGGSGDVSGSTALIARFNQNGELLWMRDTFPLGGPTMREGAPLPDGSFFTAGHRGFELIVQHFDRDGNRTMATAWLPTPTVTINDVAARLNDAGEPELFVVGFMNNGIVTASDPVVLKFNAAGALAWGRVYLYPGDDELNGITVSADGSLLLCGHTSADVPPPPYGTPDPGNVLKNAVDSGLLMRVDADTGEVIWAQAFASRWGMDFLEVTEAPDGTIYAGGAAGKIVTQTRPSNLFAKFRPDGSLIHHVLVGDDPDWVDELPNGGNSPYDTVTSLLWTPEGLVACGNTGLGTGTAGWVMGLTEELGVKYYSVFDGDDSESLLDLTDAGDGVVVVGNSRSIDRMGKDGSPASFVMKLPWEGMMRFHENTGLRSLFLQPRIYHSSGTLEFQTLSTVGVPGGAFTAGRSFASVTFSNAPITLEARAAVNPLNTPTNPIVVPLEKLDPAMVEDFGSWAAYHRLPTSDPEADTDSDGTPNILESYFAQNPWMPNTLPPFTISSSSTNGQQFAILEFERPTFAEDFAVSFVSSVDLVTWTAETAVQQYTEPAGPQTALVRLFFPATTTMRFYRAVAAP